MTNRQRSRLVAWMLIVGCLAAGCSPDGGQTVQAGGRPTATPSDTVTSTTTDTPTTTAPMTPPPSTMTTTTVPAATPTAPTTSVPPTTPPAGYGPPSTSTTVPGLPVEIRGRPTTTTTGPRPPTTVLTAPPATSLRRPVAYAAGQAAPNGPGVVIPITPAGTAGEPIPVGGLPVSIAVTRDGATALVANTSGYVSVIDTDTSRLVADIPVCVSAAGIAVTPDGTSAWVTCGQQGPIQPGSVQPVDLIRRRALDPIAVGNLPYSIVISPDGKTAYVLNYNGSSPADPEPTVVPIDIASRAAGAPIRIGYREGGAMALSPDGRTLYAVSGNGCCASSVAVIDTATNKVTRSFPSRCTGARSLAITADGTTGYLGCFNGVTPTTLDRFTESQPQAPGHVRSVALSTDGKTLYAADWGGNLVVFVDVATMQTCGYVQLHNAEAAAVVPGVIPNVPCAKPVP